MKTKSKEENSGDYEVVVVKSLKQTKGEYSLLEVILQPGQGNDLHFHTTFTEYFQVVSGRLSIQVEKEIMRLGPDETATANIKVNHRFFNDSDAPVTFRCTIRPARNFEKVVHIVNGLKKDGRLRENGMPKNFWHLIVLFNYAESYFSALPYWLQRMIFSGFGRITHWNGVEKELNSKYCGESSVVLPKNQERSMRVAR